jgi:hypothetical protein
METDYRKAICFLIEDGYITEEQAREAVTKVRAISPDKGKDSESWTVARRLVKELRKAIVANGKKPFRENDTVAACFEKMVRLDKRTEEEALVLIEWCASHDFWSTVILSPEKFRKHYETMLAQRERDNKKPVDRTEVVYQQIEDYENRRAEELARRRAESVPMPAGFKDVLKGGRK